MEHNHQRDGGVHINDTNVLIQHQPRSHSTPLSLSELYIKVVLDFVYFFDPRKSINEEMRHDCR